jgi:phospholipid/cholesterol/gamma-HCH transport system substrate-binding protein
VSEYETIQRRRNIIVGLFVIVGICALVWLIFRFGDLPGIVTKVGSFEVFVQFPTAPGVQKDTPVRFCGYQIGRVMKVMAPEIRAETSNGKKTGREYHQAVVVLNIDEQYVNVPSNVKVKLMTRGLGSSYIELKVDPANLTPPPLDPNRPETKFLVDKMLLQGSAGMTSEFFPEESQKKLDELVENFRVLLVNANDIIGGRENKENINITIANLAEASQHLTQTVAEFRKFAATGTSTLNNADAKIEQVASAMVDTSEEFKEFAAAGTSTLKNADAKAEQIVIAIVDTSEELSKATSELRSILEKIDSGQGTAARFVNDGRFYENMLENAQQMQVLLEELASFVAQARDKGVPIKLK